MCEVDQGRATGHFAAGPRRGANAAPPLALAAMAAAAALAGGCASSRPAEQAPAAPAAPVDFALDVTVLAGTAWLRAEASRGPLDSTGRYVLLCDGSLHWGPQPKDFPPRRRVLEWEQMHDLWLLGVELGLMDPAGADPPVDPRLVQGGPGEMVYVAIVTAGDKRWMYERRAGADQPADEAMSRFVDRLAALAWVGPPRIRASGVEDFGPDPYARYRR